MKLIAPGVHRILDFVAVVVLLFAPFGIGTGIGLPAALCWTLAVVFLLLALATPFPGKERGAVSLVAHGFIELLIAILMVASPWIFGFGPGSPARHFFVAAGAVVFVVWLLSDYARRGVQRI